VDWVIGVVVVMAGVAVLWFLWQTK
jgi:hypothetical protein